MKTRILTAAVGLPVLIVVLLVAPLWVAGVAMGLICTLAAYELLHMALGKSPRRLYFSVMLCAFVLPVMFSIGLEFSWAVGVLLLIYGIQAGVTYGNAWLLNNVVSRYFCAGFRIRLSEKLSRLPVSYMDRTPAGDVIDRMMQDVSSMADSVYGIVEILLSGFLQVSLLCTGESKHIRM